MSILKQINSFFNTIIKKEFEEISVDLLLTEEEQEMLRLRYVTRMNNSEVAAVMGCSLHHVETKLVTIRKKLAKLPLFKKEPFDINNVTEEEIRARCIKMGKNEDYISFCVDAFARKLTRKEMARKYHLEPDTIKKYKSARRKELLKL